MARKNELETVMKFYEYTPGERRRYRTEKRRKKMKTEITYACGHKGTVNICGIKADRDRGLRWLEKYTLCPACKAAKRKKSIRKAIAKTTRMHLPRLKGTPEQIDQARSVRAVKLQEARIFLNRKLPWRIKKRYREFYKWYRNQKEAVWWIDRSKEDPRVTYKLQRRSHKTATSAPGRSGGTGSKEGEKR